MARRTELSAESLDWPAPRLKHVVKLIAGATPSTADSDNWTSGNQGIAWVTIGDMTRMDPVIVTEKRVTCEAIAVSGLTVAPPGTLLLSMYASLGQVAETGVEACWNQAILGVFPRSNEFDKRFLKYALIALGPVLREHARSNTQANLNAEQVANTRIPRPPLDEQRRIPISSTPKPARSASFYGSSESSSLVSPTESLQYCKRRLPGFLATPVLRTSPPGAPAELPQRTKPSIGRATCRGLQRRTWVRMGWRTQ